MHMLVLSEFGKRVIITKIDFLNNASKFEILYDSGYNYVTQLLPKIVTFIFITISSLYKR